GVHQPAVLKIAHEARLIDGADRPDPHRSGRRLPEARHKPGMGIGAEARAAGLAPVALQVLFREPAFEEGARVDARRRVRLEENDIAVSSGAEEMIEADLENLRRRSVSRDVAAKLARGQIGA